MLIEKKVEVTQPDGIKCDVCKKVQEEAGKYEFASLIADWGYFSNGKDGTTSECHMCESCYDKVEAFIKSIGGEVRIMINGKRIEGIDFVIR